MKATDAGGVQVIARAAAVLRSLERQPQGLSLGEIAARVALPRSTVQRIVAALSTEGLLMSASPNLGVKLGPALMQLASAAGGGIEKTALPLMKELSRLADETVDLSVLQGAGVVFVEQILGTQRLVAVSAVGRQFPLHCTANGKSLLAMLRPERRARLLPRRLKRFTESTMTDRAVLDAALRGIEATGFAFDLEEHSVGICAVGTAFVDPFGREYSLSIPVPTGRFAEKKTQLSKLLMKTKTELLSHLMRD